MNANQQYHRNHRKRFALLSIVTTISLFAVMVPIILAQSNGLLTADLTQSYKSVDKTEALPGELLKYSIVLENSADQAVDVLITDTLPAGLSYKDGSFTADGGRGSFSINGNVINWFDSLAANEQLTLRFHTAISDSVLIGAILTNTVQISGTGNLITRTAVTSVVSQTHMYMPVMFKSPPTPHLALLEPVNFNNAWTIGWFVDGLGDADAQFEVQEDNSPNFTSPKSSLVSPPTSMMQFNPPVNWQNAYYYRVRVVMPYQVGDWSNVVAVAGNYLDSFDNPNSGWTMRREDTDEVQNSTYYSNGTFVHRMRSRWDFLIGGPLMQAPSPPYRIESRIKLDGAANLHSYGIIFGGDWDGTTCPNRRFTSCYNQYYRLLVIWYGNKNKLKYQLKAITSHDPGNGHARGPQLIDFTTVSVPEPSKGWQEWAVEVFPSGLIQVFVNDNLVGQAIDNRFTYQPYFGTFSADDEYPGVHAVFDWYSVKSLTP